MHRSHRVGWGLVAIGLALVVLVRIRDPWPAPPLYDGVVVIAPYEWLDPPPGELGGALGTSDKIVVKGGQNQIVAVATGEQPPQAQILATPGALVLGPGATSLSVSITPIEPAQPVSDGYIDGNVYRMVVVDQLGRPATAPASAYVSIFLRSANPADADGTIERFDGSSWVPIETSSEGGAGFLAIVTSFGDFAVVGTGPSPFATTTPVTTATAATSTPTAAATPGATIPELPTPQPSTAAVAPSGAGSVPLLAVAGGVAAIVVLGGLLLFARRRRAPDAW